MADTLERRVPQSLSVRGHLWNAVLRAVCARRGHHWQPQGKVWAPENEWNLPHGRRDYCSRCESSRVVFRWGEEIVATKAEVWALEPVFYEALYEARWGEPPRRELWRGEVPAL